MVPAAALRWGTASAHAVSPVALAGPRGGFIWLVAAGGWPSDVGLPGLENCAAKNQRLGHEKDAYAYARGGDRADDSVVGSSGPATRRIPGHARKASRSARDAGVGSGTLRNHPAVPGWRPPRLP